MKICMAAIPLDKINYDKESKYANVLIFKEFYPKTKNVSYYMYIKMIVNFFLRAVIVTTCSSQFCI